MKDIFQKNKTLIVGIIVTILIVGGAAGAAEIFSAVQNAEVVNQYFNVPVDEEVFDVGGTTNYDSLSLSGTLAVTGATTLTGAVTSSGDLTVGDDLTVSGNDINTNSVNERYVSGSCTAATTTPIAFVNPFAATSTIVWFQYSQTGPATTTFDIDIGTSATAYVSGDTLIDGLAVATNTQTYMTNGDVDAGTNSLSNAIIDPTEYVTGVMTLRDSNLSGAITESTSSYACTYKAKFVK